MEAKIDQKELLERIVKLEQNVILNTKLRQKVRKLFTKIVILFILVLATLIAHTYLSWREYGWR